MPSSLKRSTARANSLHALFEFFLMTSLEDLQVLVLDLQASGASPKHGAVMQAGWIGAIAGASTSLNLDAIEEHYAALPTDASIPRNVTRVTGIRDEDLEGADAWPTVWAAICDRIGSLEHQVVVIHYARYEKAFIDEIAATGENPALQMRIVCTHEIAKRLFPDMPRRGLRALAGYFGMGIGELRQSAEHVQATAFVWTHLVSALADRGIETLGQLDEFLASAPPPRGKRVYPMPREVRLALPEEPGVYRMLRSSGDVLYVGKATSLKQRVNSYFRKHKRVDERMLEMLTQARELDVTPTVSAFEAALLETDEIKRLDPRYNQALRERGRSPWFASEDLRSLSPKADDTHVVGPLGNTWWASRYAAICELVDGEYSIEVMHRALGGGSDEADEAELEEGWQRFAEEVGPAVAQPGPMKMLGRELWRQSREEDAALAGAEEEPGAEDEGEWDAEKAHARLLDGVMTMAHAIRRAEWLRRLDDSVIAWERADGSVRWLRFVDAVIVGRGSVSGWEEAPGIPEDDSQGQAAAGLPGGDIATYDRLRVALSELRRVVAAGREAVVLTGGRRFETGDLREAFEWI